MLAKEIEVNRQAWAAYNAGAGKVDTARSDITKTMDERLRTAGLGEQAYASSTDRRPSVVSNSAP